MWGEKGLSACTSSGLTQLHLGSIKGCSACPVASLPVHNGETQGFEISSEAGTPQAKPNKNALNKF